jgi:membrane protease YdiL (CAAX protease family)
MRWIQATWRRVPTAIRAVVEGMLVQLVGVLSFSLLFQINLGRFPDVPWATPVALVLLWVMWKYLNGSGWPRSTSDSRRRRLRARKLDRRLIPATICSGVLLGSWIACQVIFGYRLVSMPAAAGGAFLTLASAPIITATMLLLTGAIMTGFVEEAAFRGYMQVPIEERHGGTIGIAVVAVIFAAVHLPPLLLFPLFVVGAVGWGVMARLTRSTVPGMAVHAAVDAGFFMWVLNDPEGFQAVLQCSALDDGIDGITVAAGIATLVTGILLIVSFVWLARVGRANFLEDHGGDAGQ